MSITEDQTIWFPGIYNGRPDAEYTQSVVDVLDEETIIALVQLRAKEDGEWSIDNGFVGDNEDKMRKMMAWVSDETNIRQAVEAIRKETQETDYWEKNEPRTVDWLCRDLANGSKWVANRG